MDAARRAAQGVFHSRVKTPLSAHFEIFNFCMSRTGESKLKNDGRKNEIDGSW